MSVKEELREIVRENGCSYFGVAPVSRFKNLPKEHRPETLLRGAKSVVVAGMRISNSALIANEQAYNGIRHCIFSYTVFGNQLLSDHIDWALLRCVFHLENRYGVSAFGVPSGRPKDEERQEQLLSARYAAVAAGLGEMGMSGFVITPKDGPRVRFGCLITDMELEPDSLYTGKHLCQYPACTACIDACPAQALSREERIHLEIEDYKTDYALRSKPRCHCATEGLLKGTPGRMQAEMPEKMETMDDWYGLSRKDSPWQRMEFSHGNYCQRCMVVCPAVKIPQGG